MGRGEIGDQGKDATASAFASLPVLLGLWLVSVAFVFVPLAWLITDLVADPAETTVTGVAGDPLFLPVAGAMVATWTLIAPLLLTGWADRKVWMRRMVLAVPAIALFLLLGIAQLLIRLLDRKSEFEADLFAAEIGYRQEMVGALAELREIYGDPEPNKPWSPARLGSTHPPFTDRISALTG